MKNLNDWLNRVKAYCAKATAGPWGLTRDGDIRTGHTGANGYSSEAICELKNYRYARWSEKGTNAQFIANSRTDLEKAIKIVEAAVKMREVADNHNWQVRDFDEAVKGILE